jgi:hypothetical protein
MGKLEDFISKICGLSIFFLAFHYYAFSQKTLQLFHCMGDLTEKEKKIMANYSIKQLMVFDGRYIDPKNSGFIDSVTLSNAIITHFPIAEATGIGLLDLEDENYKSLRKEGKSDVLFDQALGQFLKMIRIAKGLRPNVKWGIYNIPFNTYWDKTELWKNQQTFLDPLFREVDIFTPALYDFYPANVDWADDKAYFTDNIKVALKLGKEYNKPVIPYIWHRWHESNPNVGLQLIDINEFDQNLQWITKTGYENTFVSGLIWFDAYSYFYHIKPGLKNLDRQKMGTSENQTVNKIFEKYARRIATISKN